MKNKIKVLIYSEKWGNAGVESIIMGIYRNIDRSIFQVDIASTQEKSKIYVDEIEQLGGKKFVLIKEKVKSPLKRIMKNIQTLKTFFISNKYDVVHFNINNSVTMMYAYIAKKSGVNKVIVHSHNSYISGKHKKIKVFANKIFKMLFSKYIDVCIACSDLAAEWMFPKKIIKNNECIILNNSIDIDKFKFSNDIRNVERHKFNFDNKLVVGHVGRFTEQKNHIYILKVFKKLLEKEKDAILLLIGQGELESDIKSFAQKLNIIDNIVFFGESKEVYRLLMAMDVFILPSLYEGKPVVAIEAQTTGLPCLMSNKITKSVKKTETSKFIPIDEININTWVSNILDVAKSDYNRSDGYDVMKRSGFDIKDNIKIIEEIYRGK